MCRCLHSARISGKKSAHVAWLVENQTLREMQCVDTRVCKTPMSDHNNWSAPCRCSARWPTCKSDSIHFYRQDVCARSDGNLNYKGTVRSRHNGSRVCASTDEPRDDSQSAEKRLMICVSTGIHIYVRLVIQSRMMHACLGDTTWYSRGALIWQKQGADVDTLMKQIWESSG